MNQTNIFRIFDEANDAPASFTARLLAEGIASRADARPLAMMWASKKYGEPVKDGQRGLTFVHRGTAAEQAVTRVLGVCFPTVDKPKAKRKSVNKTDAVAKLIKAYQSLSAAEKRRFKNAL